MQALHALGLVDPKLCMPCKDPAQFVRALAPYLKVLAGALLSVTCHLSYLLLIFTRPVPPLLPVTVDIMLSTSQMPIFCCQLRRTSRGQTGT